MDLVPAINACRFFDPMGEQQAPSIGGITAPGRNAGKGGDQGSFKGILQQDGPVKSFPAQVLGQEQFAGHPPVAAFPVIDEYSVNMGAGSKHITYPGQGQQGDFSIREIFAYGPNCRGGHDRIPDPVGGADKESYRFAGKVLHFSCSLFRCLVKTWLPAIYSPSALLCNRSSPAAAKAISGSRDRAIW